MGKKLLEKIQDRHCDMTRTTTKRFRVLRNVGMAAPYFPIDEPVLCFGSGDGFEVEIWGRLGFSAIGCEISTKKRQIAEAHGCRTVGSLDDIERLGRFNIYSAHTIEHVQDYGIILERLAAVTLSTACIFFPIEPYGSKNPSHLSPVAALDDVRMDGMRTVVKTERWNDEREGVIIFKRPGEGAL